MPDPRDMEEAEKWIHELFDVLDNLNWNGGFCLDCRDLTHNSDMARCATCDERVCTKCVMRHQAECLNSDEE
jgi:hypothetical protein